jgi:hypothetical protein
VDPVPDPVILENLVAPEIEPGTSGLAARNSDHWTTEAVIGDSVCAKSTGCSALPCRLADAKRINVNTNDES